MMMMMMIMGSDVADTTEIRNKILIWKLDGMMPLHVLKIGEMTIPNYIFKKQDINWILFFEYLAELMCTQ